MIPLENLLKSWRNMLNLNPNDAVTYTPEQRQAIEDLMANRGSKKGKELWEETGADDVLKKTKDSIRTHLLNVQKVRCAYCECILGFGITQIEHFAPKWKFAEYLYEPLNLVCSCSDCNSLPKKGKRITIKGDARPVYTDNEFKYVHPFLDNVDKEIKYRTLFRIRIDYEHCTEKGRATVDMFHWNTTHAEMKRFQNLLVRTTSRSRRKIIEEILDFKE